jgi:hypothetical protein
VNAEIQDRSSRDLAREATFASVGVRDGVKRGRLAVDIALQRRRVDTSRASTTLIGMRWRDL